MSQASEKKQLSDWSAIQGLYEAAQAALLRDDIADDEIGQQLREALAKCDEMIAFSDAHEKVIEQARELYENSGEGYDMRIDSAALVSVDTEDEGYWVTGRYWVYQEDVVEDLE